VVDEIEAEKVREHDVRERAMQLVHNIDTNVAELRKVLAEEWPEQVEGRPDSE